MEGFVLENASGNALPESLQQFSLQAKAVTDLWRKPPASDTNNAPTFTKSIPARQFKSVKVTVSAEWGHLYDQGGIVIFFPKQGEWLKTGVEFFDGKPHFATVTAPANGFADLSLVTIPGKSVTVEVERREVAGRGYDSSLMVYHVVNGVRSVVRQVTWAFGSEEGDLKVGVCAARPLTDPKDPDAVLTVHFAGFSVTTR